MRKILIIAAIFFTIGAVIGILAENKEVERKEVSFKIYFHKDDPMSCDLTQEFSRSVPYTLRVADAALKELFKGPRQQELNSGAVSTFEPNSVMASQGLKPLREYYRGVSIREGIAIVDFTEEALFYLNSAACMQFSVKSPIIDTLKQFPTVSEVRFSIDGELWTEWDA